VYSYLCKLKSDFGFILTIVVITVLALEGISYFGERYLASRGVIYRPANFDKNADSHRLKPDPRLGWPSPELFGEGEYDHSGSRLIPAFPNPDQKACVSTYGDSYTWGHEVGSEAAWSNVLSQLLNCRVANFGVGGYGTDQAYLRFKYNNRDNAKIVILGYFSENLVRNVTQFLRFLYATDVYALKPRFVLENGSLKLIPLPQLSPDDYRAMTQDPGKFLLHDYLLPGGRAVPSQAGFPYTLSLLRAFGNYRVQAVLQGKSFWTDFYRAGHPSHALEITTLIMKSFYRDAQLSGKIPIIIVAFPWVLDLRDHQKNHTWVFQPLIDNLHASGIDVLNIADGLADYLGSRNPCELFTTCDRGHYTAQGNAVVAKLIAEYLSRKNLLQK